MASEDIYGNKVRYEESMKRIHELVLPIEKRSSGGQLKRSEAYVCKNSENLKYFEKVANHLEAQDISFVRRNRLMAILRLIVHATDKDLKACERDDVNKIVSFMHSHYKSPKSKSDFFKNLKYIWKVILPDLDERGRADETIIPYVVRHLKNKVDHSQERMRDVLTTEEMDRLLLYFHDYPSVQSFIVCLKDGLIRPQELGFRKISDISVFSDRIEIRIKDHGKEKPRTAWSRDALPYMTRWLNQHPFRNNPDANLFLNKKFEALHPLDVNKVIRTALKKLNIQKKITCYCFNHAGISEQLLVSPIITQKKRGWTSLKQAKAYDHNTHIEAIQAERKLKEGEDTTLTCTFCQTKNSKENNYCETCKRALKETNHEQNSMIALANKFFEKPEVQELFKKMVAEMAGAK